MYIKLGLNTHIYNVSYLINTLPGNSSVNMIHARNSRASCVFHVSGSWRRSGDITQQQ
jgi:hypothetical protein